MKFVSFDQRHKLWSYLKQGEFGIEIIFTLTQHHQDFNRILFYHEPTITTTKHMHKCQLFRFFANEKFPIPTAIRLY